LSIVKSKARVVNFNTIKKHKKIFFPTFVEYYLIELDMKTILLTLITLITSLFSFSQTTEKGTILRVEPNGVVVYKPIGVENITDTKPQNYQKIEPQTQNPPVKTIDDYTLEELEYMYSKPDIDDKIEYYKSDKTGSEESRKAEIERCLAYKKAIKYRIEELKNSGE